MTETWEGPNTAPKDGTIIKGKDSSGEEHFYVYRRYKPKGAEQMGVDGRWQKLNEYGGWNNTIAPTVWRHTKMSKSKVLE